MTAKKQLHERIEMLSEEQAERTLRLPISRTTR
jgi:hypothetical protein